MKIHVEVFIGSRVLGQNHTSFTTEDLIRFIHKEFGDNRPGVTTHVSSACIANTNLNHPTGYNYLWRVEHGDLRPFRPGLDNPDPERIKHRTQPEPEDMPEKYRHFLHN
jgi:hypothetical protein